MFEERADGLELPVCGGVVQGRVAGRVGCREGRGGTGGEGEEVGEQGGVRGAGGEHQLPGGRAWCQRGSERGGFVEGRSGGGGDAVRSRRLACSSRGYSAGTSLPGAWLRPRMSRPRVRAGCPSWHSC